MSDVSLEVMQEDSLYFRLFFIYSTLTVAIFFFGVADRFFLSKRGRLEFPILLLFIHFGGLFALRRHTFRDRLIALERVTLASYVFVTFERQNRFSTYAGVQYFILGSFPSARLLLAFALFYLQSGSRAFQDRDRFFNTTYDITGIHASQNVFKLEYVTIVEQDLSNIPLSYLETEVESSFLSFFPRDQIESITSALNSVNSRSVRALLFLFFNFFFKITAAPFHV
jgi:NADH:ubiquinone oxidoreductase subunit 2 (subunit N)